MGEVIELQGQPANLEDNHDFVADCCRYQEGILSEANMKRKYGFADNVWERLGDDTKLLAAVEDEKIRRIRSGRQKRERAQLLVTRAPDVVSAIMLDPAANARHRIDAAASLDKFAANPQDNTPAALDRFIIRIDLSAGGGSDDILQFNKSIAINPNDGDLDGGSAHGSLPIANKWDADDVAPVHTGYKLQDYEAAGRHPRNAPLPVDHGPARAKQKTVRLVEKKTPEQLALESLMRFE